MSGDAGEGLIDADARIQERMDELEEARKRARLQVAHGDPEVMHRIESLRLARTDLEAQLETTTHEARRQMLRHAIADLDTQSQALQKKPTPAPKSGRSKK